MKSPQNEDDLPEAYRQLISKAESGSESALAELYAYFKPRLRKVITARMDPALKGRVDPSDVLQDAFLDLQKRLPSIGNKNGMSMFVWMRLVATESLINAHRKHIQTKSRDARREIPFHDTASSSSTNALAGYLLEQFTSAGNRLIRKEMQKALQSALDALGPLDREIIMMRNFEGLSNQEIAESMEMSKTGASNRYVRAMSKLTAELRKIPGFLD